MAASPVPAMRASSDASGEMIAANIPQAASADVDHLIGSLSNITVPS